MQYPKSGWQTIVMEVKYFGIYEAHFLLTVMIICLEEGIILIVSHMQGLVFYLCGTFNSI